MLPREPGPLALLGTDSVSWQLGRPWRKLGLQRNVLMQLARPEIAAAIAQHSDFLERPLQRFSRTMGSLRTIRHGSPAERDALLRRLATIHAASSGQTDGGQAYTATDPELQWWVLACGIDTALEVERRFRGALSETERTRYYEEQRAVVAAFGIPWRLMPPTFVDFGEWMHREVQLLEVTDDARRIATVLLDPATLPAPRPAGATLRLLTAGLLPEALRAPYGLELTPSRARRLAVAEAAIRTSIRTGRLVDRGLPGRPVGRFAMRLEARLTST